MVEAGRDFDPSIVLALIDPNGPLAQAVLDRFLNGRTPDRDDEPPTDTPDGEPDGLGDMP